MGVSSTQQRCLEQSSSENIVGAGVTDSLVAQKPKNIRDCGS